MGESTDATPTHVNQAGVCHVARGAPKGAMSTLRARRCGR